MKTPKEILFRSSKKLCLEAVEIAKDSDDFLKELLRLSLSKEAPFNWRASWAILYFSEKYPEKIEAHLTTIVRQMPYLENHTQVGSFLRIFDRIKIDLEEYGHLLDFCLHVIRMPQEREYVKVLALNILLKFGKAYPELSPELIQQIEASNEVFEMRHLKKLSQEIHSKLIQLSKQVKADS